MNTQNLHELIRRYHENLNLTMNSEHREQMKWEATKCFHDVWFSDQAAGLSFAEKFKLACSGSSIVINNSTISPTNGIVKMAEKDPEKVEHLFKDILFADDGGNLSLRGEHMQQFMDEIEDLRLKLFPKYWKYQQDRHAVSCYLAFWHPEENYIYRYSDAILMARYIEFDRDLGSGRNFNLPAYYELCGVIVDALKEHPELLADHAARLDDRYYQDESLHIMTFDLMYCSRCYKYYRGLPYTQRARTKKEESQRKLDAAEKLKAEQIERLSEEKEQLESAIADMELVSLVGTEVTSAAYGTGTIIKQNGNQVTVHFPAVEKDFVIHKKYSGRPQFEDNEEILEAMSAWSDCNDRLMVLERKLGLLLK